MGNSNVDSNATTDFKALQDMYAELQNNAYTATGTHGKGQSVTADEIAALAEKMDNYINSHVTDEATKKKMLDSVEPLLSTMSTDVAEQQSSGKTDNSGWDTATSGMHDLIDQIAPPDAAATWTAPAAGSDGGVSGSANTGTQNYTVTGDPNTESGNGWNGANLNLAASSKNYEGKSLDQLLADKNSIVAREVGNQPDLVAAIKTMSAKYNVPDGLIAAVVIQESNGDRTNKTYNDGYSDQPGDQRFDVGVVQSPLWDFPGNSTAEKEKNAQDPAQCIERFCKEFSADYKKSGSWGVALRNWNSGGDANPNDLSNLTGGYGVSTYVSNILGHIATGGDDYGAG